MSNETMNEKTAPIGQLKEETKAPVENTNETVAVTADDSAIQTLVADRVQSELAKIKASLDNAYAERDQFKVKANELAKEKQRTEIEALEKAGKHSEVLKIEMNEIKNELEMYKKRNTELSRDNVVKSQLSALDFKSDKAAKLAHKDIIAQLKQDSSGNWMHESGVTVNEAINAYAKDDANAFMFKVKENTGTKIEAPKAASTTAPTAPVKDIREMTTEEMLKAAEQGLIGDKSRFTQ